MAAALRRTTVVRKTAGFCLSLLLYAVAVAGPRQTVLLLDRQGLAKRR